MKKIIAQVFMLVLVVYISLSFAQQPVTITIFKNEVESDLAGFNLYQEDATIPFATISSKITPWIWTGDITLTNGKTDISATAFDVAGNESTRSPKTAFDPAPGSPDRVTVVKIEVKIITGE
jgi:hypothetical protein